MISLTYSGTTLELPEDLLWSDELTWQPVEQTVERSITGALIVQSAARVAGRPITLAPEDDESAWMSRAVLDALRTWAAVPGREMVLNVGGVDRTVVFRHQEQAIDARPVVHYSEMVAGDAYLVTLRFMEV